jgi:hypothetical protein
MPSLADRLSSSSAAYRDPLAQVDWDALEPDVGWMPEEKVSLYGLPEWDALSGHERVRLAQSEMVAFLELGLWLEALFMERIAGQARRGAGDLTDLNYQLHELREEAGHSLMFVELLRRSGFTPLAAGHRRPRTATHFARRAPFDSAGFWIAILLGEAVPDQVNRLLYRDERVPLPIRQVILVHMREEARHIAYARKRSKERLAAMPAPVRAGLARVMRPVFRQFVDECFHPPPAVFARAGLERPRELARRARANPRRRALVEACVGPAVDDLAEQGLRLRPIPGGLPGGVAVD